ncbi:Ig-like domain-containing protein [Deinococcus fonticola]|uniref:Ig-like domain-containing protein n=1 Tax=Deinococcus fonticola TaxID=2528713 RepID=UPI00107544C5|nr:Ig-like domain-containing protein [Deinococcus fonticola]
MLGKRWISIAALALALTSCAQPAVPKVTDDDAPVITKVWITDNNATMADTLMVADVSDDVGLAKVEFYIGANKVGEVDAKSATGGSYSVKVGEKGYACLLTKVIATDTAGNRTEANGSTRCI